MAVGKNKRLTKGGKKGGKKKAGDPFLRKEWYDIKAPSMFSVRQCGKTLVSRTQGTKIATEELKGRVQGRSCLTDFHGMTLTRDKICSLIKKWQTLIEAHVDVKTTDGYVVRMFCIAFTKRRPDQVRANCYAQSAQIRKIRRKMVEVMQQEASKVQLRELVKKLIPESIGKEIEKQAQGIFPLKDVLIRKVKILKKPKFDITKLMELHGDGGDDVGVEMMRPEADDAVNTLTADPSMARCTKWDFLEDDPDLDEEGQAAFAEASELREQDWPAVTMYGRADALLKPRVSTALEKAAVPAALAARELALQCRLNAACLALEAATVPSTGSSGLKNAEQAEEASRRLALEALQLDATNPHAALLLARWGALLEKREASEVAQWLSKAKRWAQERKDQETWLPVQMGSRPNSPEALAQAEALDSQLHPPPSSWGKEASDWLRMGVHLLKQGKAPEAKKLFMQTVDYLDQQEGGPIELLLSRPLRALAFDALEGLMESFAATEQFADAVRCGQRATSLLNSTRPGMQVPFAEPELSRREGLLHLSIGHAAEANGEKDALRHFRLAAQALQRSGSDAASEGVAVLELGKRLESKADPEALDLAVPEDACGWCAVCGPRIGEEKGTKPTEEVCQRLRFRELQAQAALCEAYQIRGDRPDAEEVIEASKYLLPKAGGLALDWAELCGKWAFHAAKAGKLDEAEEALRLKWNLSGGKDTPENAALEIEDKAPCPFQQRCIQLQQEALQSLALVQQKAQNPVGSLGLLSQTGAQEGEMERHLQRLAPAPGASKEASCCQKYMKHFALHKGARLWLACLAAVAAVLLQKTMSGHPSEQLLNQSAV
eukprot:g15657.t1